MFVSHDDWPPPPPWEPRRTPPLPRRLGARGEKLLLWVIGLNLLMLFAAPIAGVSVVQLLWMLVG